MSTVLSFADDLLIYNADSQVATIILHFTKTLYIITSKKSSTILVQSSRRYAAKPKYDAHLSFKKFVYVLREKLAYRANLAKNEATVSSPEEGNDIGQQVKYL